MRVDLQAWRRHVYERWLRSHAAIVTLPALQPSGDVRRLGIAFVAIRIA
jgi:hypothetical protein